jgi:hypothetical protein
MSLSARFAKITGAPAAPVKNDAKRQFKRDNVISDQKSRRDNTMQTKRGLAGVVGNKNKNGKPVGKKPVLIKKKLPVVKGGKNGGGPNNNKNGKAGKPRNGDKRKGGKGKPNRDNKKSNTKGPADANALDKEMSLYWHKVGKAQNPDEGNEL